MKTTAKITGILNGLTGLTQIVIGAMLWAGKARSLTSFHMTVGVLFVLSLWTLALIAGRFHVGKGLGALAVLWGIVVLLFGIAQPQIMPGSGHWVIRVVHLLLGLAAMAQAGVLARRIRASASPHPTSAAPELGPVR